MRGVKEGGWSGWYFEIRSRQDQIKIELDNIRCFTFPLNFTLVSRPQWTVEFEF